MSPVPTSPKYTPMDMAPGRSSIGPVVPQIKYIAPFSAGCAPTVVSFRFLGEQEGLPIRVLRNIRALDLPIEGRDITPFDESIATTITLRIWVSFPGRVLRRMLILFSVARL